MNQHDIEELYKSNAKELEKMNTAAGVAVDALLRKSEKNDAGYVRLHDGFEDSIYFKFIEGDFDKFCKVAESLGLDIEGENNSNESNLIYVPKNECYN